MTDKAIVHGNRWILDTVSVKSSSTFGLTLGEIREFVRQADLLAVPDKADVRFDGVRQSAVYRDECTAREINLRHQSKPEGS